jgi:hypothetical protein
MVLDHFRELKMPNEPLPSPLTSTDLLMFFTYLGIHYILHESQTKNYLHGEL